jgi:hypothetical protein
MVDAALAVWVLLRAQQISLSFAVLFGALFLFLFVGGRVAIALGARSLAKSQRPR